MVVYIQYVYTTRLFSSYTSRSRSRSYHVEVEDTLPTTHEKAVHTTYTFV